LTGFDINLGNRQAITVFIGDLLEDWRDHLAGTTPLRPEINENGAAGLQDLACEIVVGNVLYAHDPLNARGLMSE
jgi:hypothetical protein